MNWSLRAMFLLVATVAVALYIIRANYGSYSFLLGLYILLTSVVVVGSIPTKSLFRPGFIGASIFGVSYFVFVLKAGYGVETTYDTEWLRGNILRGITLLGLSFMASQLCAMIVWPRTDVKKEIE